MNQIKNTEDLGFQKVRLIMTKDEIEIYKLLPDDKSKKEFWRTFWKQRDPIPHTDENEAKLEFESRIKYANMWFLEGTKNRGWDTERGRMLLQLGFPDERETRPKEIYLTQGGRRVIRRVPTDLWIYYRYEMALFFVDENSVGDYKLYNYPPKLLTAIKQAKFKIVSDTTTSHIKPLQFNVDIQSESIIIHIPVKRIEFEEEDDQLLARFEITVLVYLGYKKMDQITHKHTIKKGQVELLNKKNISISIPYVLTKKGKYFFEIILKDVLNSSVSRKTAKFKY